MNSKIADDPINGSFQQQFRWCKKRELNTKLGPLLTGPEVQPIFIRLKKPIEVQTLECGKFGGICSSKHCRDGHKKFISGS